MTWQTTRTHGWNAELAHRHVGRSLRVEATRAGIGYQTLIHKLLAAHVRKSA